MATNTYVALDKVTVSGTSTATVTFSSIPSTYTDLVIVGNLGSETTNAFPYLQFNGDAGSNYSYTELYGNGTNAYSVRVSNNTQLFNNDVSVKQGSLNSNVVYHIMNYANTTTYKTSLTRQNTVDAADYNGALAAVGLWRNTAAITSVSIKLTRGGTGYNFTSGSTFSLYGIKAWANTEASAKAIGGSVYSDSTYWYHAFPYSGTFTPTEPITADVLVIAGGGGGALAGGGAGGVQLFSSQSISTAQAVVVGAGGGAGHCGADGTTGIRGSQGGNSTFGALTASVGGGGGGALSTNSSIINGGDGGSGGGSGANSSSGGGSGGTGTTGQGYNGGAGNHVPGVYLSTGGAGGAGGAGTSYSGATNGSPGPGITTYSSWGLATYTGHNVSGTVWFASGGQKTGDSTRPNGGGGIGTNYTNFNNALQATGGGGGCTYGPNNGGNGGSGVVIVRYAK